MAGFLSHFLYLLKTQFLHFISAIKLFALFYYQRRCRPDEQVCAPVYAYQRISEISSSWGGVIIISLPDDKIHNLAFLDDHGAANM